MNRLQVVENNIRQLRKSKRKLVSKRVELIKDGPSDKLVKVQEKLSKINREMLFLIREERELKGIPVPKPVRVGMKSAQMGVKLNA